ncbi:MAG: PP2C family protein-serine/threonine phosphatase [Planctomycetales bacterium]
MAEQMQCMEIWGGNQPVEEHFHRPGLDVWLYSRPHDNAANGGDVYYLSSCASGRISRMLLADVSGHGPRVSKLALRLRDLMRSHVNSVSQTRFVEGMNREFVEFSQEGSFATALVATFFASTRSVQLCVAGHPRPLLYRQHTGAWEVFETSREATVRNELRNVPLGIAECVQYSQTQLDLRTGDMLLAYTDGLTEARVEDHQLLDPSGLLGLVRTLDATRPDLLLQSLLRSLKERLTAPLGDDLSLLLARADASRVSWRDNLLAPFRLLRRVRDKTRLR